jgi:RNA polymerase sigma-70 factor (ECF subfamily)
LLDIAAGPEYNLVMANLADDSIPTRQTLLERLKNLDDQPSWQDFFDTYWRLIYSVAIKAGLTEAEAQDVVQETVMAVTRKIADFKPDPSFGSFKSWLLLITRRRIADQFRKRPSDLVPRSDRSDDTTRTPTVERVPDPASLDWESAWDQQWQKNLVELAMERVKEQASPKEYLLFHQQVVKEWPAGKVASKYNVSRASVYMAKYRIGRLIKEEVRRLERRGQPEGQGQRARVW